MGIFALVVVLALLVIPTAIVEVANEHRQKKKRLNGGGAY